MSVERPDIELFLRDDSGAVTVDWVVLTGGLVGLGLAATAVISVGVEYQARDIADLSGQSITGLHRWGQNRLANGSFEDIEGMIAAGWGFYSAGEMNGWSLLDDPRAEVVWSGYHGVTATDGGYMLDLDASPGNMSLGQVMNDAVDGQVYTVSFDAADPRMNNGVEVYWGGELVGTADPQGTSMTRYEFEITGGSGDGSNLLMIGGTGPEDNIGAYIDNVSVES
jgi:hypothetical protein